jgi:hypothetical protein
MITAYFDDSGTHGDRSDIVLVAGIFGTEARLDNLDRNWKRHLDAPLDGLKVPIRRFHAYDCYNSVGEFERWSRTETDYFRHQLRAVIFEADVAAYGMAVARKDWDNLIAGHLRSVLGDSERFSINQCFVKSLAWAQANTFDPHMSYVFDNRPSPVQRYVGAVCDAFSRHLQPPPTLIGHSFLSSMKIRPLQAADLVAWELYRYANDILKNGIQTPAPKEILHLKANMIFDAQIATYENILRLRDHWTAIYKDKPDHLRQMANHFDAFDPSNPAYSELAGE